MGLAVPTRPAECSIILMPSMSYSTIPADSLATVKKIDGWLSDREAGLLWSCARNATGPIIEIGSHHGRSTAALGLGSMAGNKSPLFAVDSFAGVPSRHGRQAA